MKRRDLELHLRDHGCGFLREGGNHSIWFHGENMTTIPRHREINTRTVRSICRDLGIPSPRKK